MAGSFGRVNFYVKNMKITYDPRHNIAYIRFQEKKAEAETIRISDELNVDISPDGPVYGIELLNAKAQLFNLDQGKLVVVMRPWVELKK
jgi:uncharacterized protein YuzE